ncbi:MAG: transcriptional regulator [Mesorhizobium sp.]|nr:transcriptional regulator [Mesorhizobium sp.]RWI50112.1 MAG: transcriptional regulator [Mesorhizobium sp.]
MKSTGNLVRWSAKDLADAASVGVATVRRAESDDGIPSITAANRNAIRNALEAAGIEFIPENGGGPGLRRRVVRCGSDRRDCGIAFK